MSVVGNAHKVVAPGKYCAIVSTTVETDKPKEEVEPGLALLPAEARITRFDNITDSVAPVEDGVRSRVFISTTYDASSHFEQATEEVLDMYARITGERLDLSKSVEVDTT